MLRLLTLLGTVGAAWTFSQFLPTDGLPPERGGTAEIATGGVSGVATPSVGAWPVALFDLAVRALPKRATGGDDADDESVPAVPLAHTAIAPLPAAKAALASLSDAGDVSEPSLALASAEEPPDPVAVAKLARRLQKELRRVGCLRSAADGRWGAQSQQAMRRFAERVDADLPVDRPDVVLLMLVERFDNRACGAPCSLGKTPNAQGRCVAAGIEVAALAAPMAQSTIIDSGIGLSAIEQGVVPAPELSDPGRATATSGAIKTRITRVGGLKRMRVGAVVASSKRTRWSLPRYGLGVTKVQRLEGSAKPPKKGRVGQAANYRRWLKRSSISLR